MRAWTAELDRRIGTRTYAGAALLVIALATAIVAIVLAVDARDNSADNEDLNRISDQVTEISAAGVLAQTAQDDVDALEGRISSIEDQLAGVSSSGGDADKRLSVVEDDIEELRQQISDLESRSGGSSSGGTSP